MKSLNEDIKTGQFKQVYLLYGEEAYLKKQYKDRLTRAMLPEGDTMNYAYYEGKGIDGAELIDLAETMPFFAERRLIVVENSGFFKSAEPQLADYMKELPETACFLFVEQEVDKRSRMFKAVKTVGRAVELSSMGIRVDEKSLEEQLVKAGCEDRRNLPYHRMLLNGELPYTIGGGIGQSRLCMLLLDRAHVGEVQASIWPEEMRKTCKEHKIILL